MNIQKTLKVTKYFLVTSAVFFLSSVLGQKHSSDYSPINTAFADFPPACDAGCSDGDSGGCASSDSGGAGVDGASADGPGDGACSG